MGTLIILWEVCFAIGLTCKSSLQSYHQIATKLVLAPREVLTPVCP